MSDIDTLAQKIAANLTPHALWDVPAVAAYLHRSENYTRQYIVMLPGFPPAIRLPVPPKKGEEKSKGSGQPLWRSRDVIAWAESHVET